jgi:hypothetical protein
VDTRYVDALSAILEKGVATIEDNGVAVTIDFRGEIPMATLTCTNCGNDDACEGYRWCSDCMEAHPHSQEMYLTNSSQADISKTPAPQHRTRRF